MGERSKIKWCDDTFNPLIDGRRRRVFCASLADWLDPAVPDQWRADLLDLIEQTPNLDWLLLTKRPENLVKFGLFGNIPKNVWLGVSAENQKFWDQRVEMLRTFIINQGLLETKNRITFASCEPLLGPIEIKRGGPTVKWLIAGGESGPGHRPIEKCWVENLRHHCKIDGTAFFFKQWGGARPDSNGNELNGKKYEEFPVKVKE